MYVSVYDTKFITFVSEKYKNFRAAFNNFDDYTSWLLDFLGNEKRYYEILEDDLMEFCKYQEEKKDT